MEQEKDFIQKFQQLKQIKPSPEWANLLLSQILSSETKKENEKESQQRIIQKPILVKLSFLWQQYRAITAALLIMFFGVSVVAAQNSLPGDTLYPLKLLTQNIRIYLAPNSYKPLVKLQVSQERLQDLAKVQDAQVAVKKITQTVKKDIASLPADINKTSANKKIALDVSQKIKEQNQKLQNLVTKIPLAPEDKEDLQKTIQKTDQQVLAYIINTTEEINKCPSYLNQKISNLKIMLAKRIEQGKLENTPGEIVKARTLLEEAEVSFQAGDCLTALEKVDKIYQLLSIPSEENQVETNPSQR